MPLENGTFGLDSTVALALISIVWESAVRRDSNFSLAEAKAEYSTIKTALDASQVIQDNISEIEAQIALVNSEYLSIQESTDYVSDIAAITQSVPEGVVFTSLEIGIGKITVFGRSSTALSVVQFARNLELIGGYSKAEINWIDRASGSVGPAISFTIVVDK